MQMIWLRSKTTMPHPLEDGVDRERLFKVLNNDYSKKLTILRAPAGYGKTTILSQWLYKTNTTTAWLSIDSADNDPMRFWQYVVNTLSEVTQTHIDLELASLFSSQEPSNLEFLIDTFINEISNINQKISIILDDYHLIENETIHSMLKQFIEYLPENVHLYITTRSKLLHLPIARWTTKPWYREIGMELLRFNYEEIQQFYEKKKLIMTNSSILPIILKKTEGWIAGIQLAELSMRNSLSNELKFDDISGANPYIFDYLLHDILKSLPEDLQDFILQTSILDSLEPNVCNALTNRTNSLNILSDFEKMGLFIVHLNAKPPVFRYHHLFAEALQIEFKRRYTEEKIQTTIKDAANILYSNGYYISAIELLLNNHNFSLASTWITKHLVGIFTSGQTSTLVSWVRIMKNNNYPIPVEILVMDIIALISTLQYEEAAGLMIELEMKQQIEHWMEQEENLGIASIFETVKAYAIISSGGDVKQALEIIQRQLEKGLVSSRWDNIPIQYNTLEHKILRTSLGAKGKIQINDDAIALSNLMRASEFKDQHMTVFGYGLSAETMYEVNAIELASEELEIALEYGLRNKDPGLFVPMYLLKAQLYIKNENFSSAHILLTNAMELVQEKHWMHILQTMNAKCFLLEGNTIQAEKELAISKSKQPFWHLVNARLLIAKSQTNDALKMIVPVKTKALQDEQISTIIESSILEAICEKALGNIEASFVAIHEALKYGLANNYIRSFLDEKDCLPILKEYLKMRHTSESMNWNKVPLSYVNFLLESSESTNNQFESLTSREMEIFTLLAKGATNKEIANQLYLSEGTVRVYLTNIYSKLGVNSRAKAMLLFK